ncbi:MAG TPA: cation transporter [Gemmatimonadales bacterium]|jgi:copper ion binding protein
MRSVRLNVTGMTCGHCQGKVERALRAVRGVYAVDVDLAAGSAAVDFDDAQASVAQLTAAVAAVGYHATDAG